MAAGLLLAGCSSDAVRDPQQAMDIALSSDCARAQIPLLQGEKMPTAWKVARMGDNWHVWLPPDADGPDRDSEGWLKGALIRARDGTIIRCEIRIFHDLPAFPGRMP